MLFNFQEHPISPHPPFIIASLYVLYIYVCMCVHHFRNKLAHEVKRKITCQFEARIVLESECHNNCECFLYVWSHRQSIIREVYFTVAVAPRGFYSDQASHPIYTRAFRVLGSLMDYFLPYYICVFPMFLCVCFSVYMLVDRGVCVYV